MKNKKNIKKQKVYKIRRISAVVLIVLGIFLLIFGVQRRNKIQKLAVGENALEIGGSDLDLSQVLGEEPNPPLLGAGMIPIKWDDNIGMWVITTATDEDWYDYSEGKWATVMLSDGLYSSELERDKILASDIVGADASVRPEDMGTIFTWIPRLAYTENGDIAYLQGSSVVEYRWITEDCFNLIGYGPNYIDLAFTGFWVGQKEYSNIQEVENKNAEMNNEENTQGLIANEQVTKLQGSEKLVIQKLHNKTVGASSARPNENIDTMNFRQVIKIVNTNNRLPIMATHEIVGDKINISTKYTKFGINFITDKDGNKLNSTQVQIDEENSSYTFYLVDNEGNIRRYQMSYGSGKPNLKGFNLSNTFYVMYDANGNETSEIPAGETAPEDWYNYDNQRWANIVVRDNGCETYYTWIPRYMYTLDNDNQKVNAKLVDLNNVYKDPETGKEESLNNTDYVLPEAFTWEDPNDPNEKVQLAGFWISKFKLSDGGSAVSNIVGGLATITVSDITEATNETYTCEMYLIKSGKRIKWSDEEGKYIEDISPIQLTQSDYTFSNLEKGNYTVNIIIKNKATGLQESAITKQVLIIDEDSINKPNLNGYDKDHTFYVTYNNEGQEDSYIPITEDAPKNWYNYLGQKWANIVVRINENETYYTWIPRYEYALNNEEQKTNVNFIPTTQIEADTGYTIPEAFTWEDPENPDAKVALDGFWISKFKLSEGITNPSNNIYGVGNSINIDNIATNDATYNYYAYAYSKEKDENGKSKYKYWNQITSVSHTIDGSQTIGDIEQGKGEVVAGDYIVTVLTKDKQGNLVASTSRDVTVIEAVKAYQPDTKYYVASDASGNNITIGSAQTLFNPDITYYVEYDKECKNIINTDQTLNMTRPEKWYNYDDKDNLIDNPLLDATIVVREKEYDTYYKWIPRYQYSTSTGDKDSSSRVYIDINKTEPDDGYEIPKQFKDAQGNPLKYSDGTNIKGYWKQVNQVANTIKANIITTDSEIILTQIELPKNTTGKIKLTSNSKNVGEYDLTDIDGDSFTYSNLDNTKKYEISIFAYNSDGTLANIFVIEEKLFKVTVDMEAQNFNKSNTFYVVYDKNGNESSDIPIGENAPEDWYNYEERRWANVVVRDNGCETYFTWIPRYEYKIQPTTQKTSVIFISQTQETPDIGYTIPESFTWEDPNDSSKKVQLAGFWISKFKLSDGAGSVNINGGNGTITVKDITEGTDEKYICEMYLIKDGKRTSIQPVILKETNYTYTGLTKGNYTVNIVVKNNDEAKLQVTAITKQVAVTGDDFVNEPNLDGFDRAHTYYVVYDENGVETSDKLITQSAPTNWYNYEGKQWANIVVRQNENETYYTWIPRYGYALNNVEQKTNVKFIYGTGDAPQGYTIPEAFTWENPNNPNEKIQLKGFWISKFKLSEGATSSSIILAGNTIDMSKAMTNINYTYIAYLYNNNEGAAKGNLIGSTGGSTFSVSTPGHYVVTIIAKDANGNYVSAISQDIDYGTEEELNAIDAQYRTEQLQAEANAVANTVANTVKQSISKLRIN